ncbi:MAG: hypothetical protein ABI452_00550 [Candidatus Limnocylindrales bacterium]
MPDGPLFPARRAQLDRITGPLGIWQHARGAQPDRAFGMCTDDVARALTVDLLHRRTLGWEAVSTTARRSLDFLAAAFDPSAGSFRNFRDAAGQWLDDEPSQDSQGRALLALGTASRDAPEVVLRGDAQSLFAAALPGAARLTSPRAMASALLGCDAALATGMAGDTQRIFALLAGRLRGAFFEVDLDGEWPWPEETLTYENALLPRALIVAAQRLDDARLRSVGLHVLDWLVAVQTTRRGVFTPVGSDGWWTRGMTRSQFDQQPIEATAVILAAAAAYETTQDPGYLRSAEAAYAWFLGDNDVGLMVADPLTGGCHDGLSKDHANVNQGAESTLMWLTAVETMRQLRTDAMSARQAPSRGATTVLVELHA